MALPYRVQQRGWGSGQTIPLIKSSATGSQSTQSVVIRHPWVLKPTASLMCTGLPVHWSDCNMPKLEQRRNLFHPRLSVNSCLFVSVVAGTLAADLENPRFKSLFSHCIGIETDISVQPQGSVSQSEDPSFKWDVKSRFSLTSRGQLKDPHHSISRKIRGFITSAICIAQPTTWMQII